MFSRRPSRAFLQLPPDLWFEVIDYLPVTSVVHLRAVSRYFDRIVSSPVVWKRLLRKVKVMLPFQPQSIASLSAKATESLIRRALCLNINWERDAPMAFTNTLRSVERPYMIRLLPGGRWLVAATKNSEDDVYAVVVWDLENPIERGGGCALLAKCRTRTAVSHLVVRYMKFEGKMGIVIATLRQIGENPHTKTEVCVIHISLQDLEILSANGIPPAAPFKLVELHKTRCQIAYMSIDGTVLSLIHRPRTIMFIDLLDTATPKRSSQLKIHVTGEGQRHSLQACKLIPTQNQVLIIRLIHSDEHTSYSFELFTFPAWGEIAKEPIPVHHDVFPELAASSFSISESTVIQATSDRPTEREMEENCHYAAPISIFAHTMGPKGIIHYQIVPQLIRPSRFNAPTVPPEHIVPNAIGQNPAFPQPPSAQNYPSYLPTDTPFHIAPMPVFPLAAMQMAGYPSQLLNLPGTMQAGVNVPGLRADMDIGMEDVGEDLNEPLQPYYTLPVVKKAHYWFEEHNQKPAVLPGAERSVFWTRPTETRADSPPMRNLLAYMTRPPRQRQKYPTGLRSEIPDREWEFMQPPGVPENQMGISAQDDRRLKQLSLPPEFVDAVQAGTQNAAFDEGSGKLCIVAGKPAHILFLDYAA